MVIEDHIALDGKLSLTDQLISTITGIAPIIVASSVLVGNLNADLLDGYHASAFAQASDTYTKWESDSRYVGLEFNSNGVAEQSSGNVSIDAQHGNKIVYSDFWTGIVPDGLFSNSGFLRISESDWYGHQEFMGYGDAWFFRPKESEGNWSWPWLQIATREWTTANYYNKAQSDARYATAVHTHAASEITSGILAIGRIPTGNTSNTVSLGNHTHAVLTRGTGLTGSNYNGGAGTTWAVEFGSTSGTVAQGNDSRIINGQTAFSWGNHALAGYALSSHVHSADDITSGVLGIGRIPTGITSTTVALGNHTHAFSAITGKPTTIAGYGITDAFTQTLADARYSLLGHNHAVLTAGTGLNSTTYNGSAAVTFSVNFGTTAGTVAQGNDSRILNGQTAFSWGNHSLAGYLTSASLTNYVQKWQTWESKFDQGAARPAGMVNNGMYILGSGVNQTISTFHSSFGRAAGLVFGAYQAAETGNVLATGTFKSHGPGTDSNRQGGVFSFTSNGGHFIWAISEQFSGLSSENSDLTMVEAMRLNASGLSTTVNATFPNIYSKTEVDTLLTGFSSTGHTHSFASLTAKPTTLSGYGITDAFTESQADAKYSLIGHTHAFTSLTGIPTTVGGYGITDTYTKTESDDKYLANAASNIGWDAAIGAKSRLVVSSTDGPSGVTVWHGMWIAQTASYGTAIAFRNGAMSIRSVENGVIGNWIPIANQNWATPNTRNIIAGNGLTGTGNLTQDRTLTLGTPSAITLSSINTVTSESHTHAFTPGGTTAQYIRGDGSLAAFPAIPAGTVTSVGLTVPLGFAVSPASITTSGTFAMSFASGYSLPTTAKQTQWDNTSAGYVSTSPLHGNSSVPSTSLDADSILTTSVLLASNWLNTPLLGGFLTTHISSSTGNSFQIFENLNVDDAFYTRRRVAGVSYPWYQTASREWVLSRNYITASSLTGYLPLTGGTLTGNLNINDSRFSSVTAGLVISRNGGDASVFIRPNGDTNSVNQTTFSGTGAAITVTGGNSDNWNTSFGWGNHAVAGYVPVSRILTINGTAYNLGANQTISVGDVNSSGTKTEGSLTAWNASGQLISSNINVSGTTYTLGPANSTIKTIKFNYGSNEVGLQISNWTSAAAMGPHAGIYTGGNGTPDGYGRLALISRPTDDANGRIDFRVGADRKIGMWVNWNGDVTTPYRFISTVATGTSPLLVNSQTAVTNLNADLLDGLHSTDFLQIASANAYVYRTNWGGMDANTMYTQSGWWANNDASPSGSNFPINQGGLFEFLRNPLGTNSGVQEHTVLLGNTANRGRKFWRTVHGGAFTAWQEYLSAEKAALTYITIANADNKYGIRNENNIWNGSVNHFAPTAFNGLYSVNNSISIFRRTGSDEGTSIRGIDKDGIEAWRLRNNDATVPKTNFQLSLENGQISVPGGNSNEWNTAYSVVQNLSANVAPPRFRPVGVTYIPKNESFSEDIDLSQLLISTDNLADLRILHIDNAFYSDKGIAAMNSGVAGDLIVHLSGSINISVPENYNPIEVIVENTTNGRQSHVPLRVATIEYTNVIPSWMAKIGITFLLSTHESTIHFDTSRDVESRVLAQGGQHPSGLDHDSQPWNSMVWNPGTTEWVLAGYTELGRYNPTPAQMGIGGLQPDTNYTLEFREPTNPLIIYRVPFKTPNANVITTPQSILGGGSLPACTVGPDLMSVSNVTQTGLTWQFHGDGVTHIKWRIKSSGSTVREGNAYPSLSIVSISFDLLQPGNYVLEIEGGNCSSPVDSESFTISGGQATGFYLQLFRDGVQVNSQWNGGSMPVPANHFNVKFIRPSSPNYGAITYFWEVKINNTWQTAIFYKQHADTSGHIGGGFTALLIGDQLLVPMMDDTVTPMNKYTGLTSDSGFMNPKRLVSDPAEFRLVIQVRSGNESSPITETKYYNLQLATSGGGVPVEAGYNEQVITSPNSDWKATFTTGRKTQWSINNNGEITDNYPDNYNGSTRRLMVDGIWQNVHYMVNMHWYDNIINLKLPEGNFSITKLYAPEDITKEAININTAVLEARLTQDADHLTEIKIEQVSTGIGLE